MRIKSKSAGFPNFERRNIAMTVPDRMTATRHLAAILAADVVGYFCLMGADEAARRTR
jgi:class 3 adenylate cyclase